MFIYTLSDETTSPIPTLTFTVETHLLYTSYQTISLSDSSDSINLFNLIPFLGLKDIHMAMEVYHMRLSQSPHESYEYSNYKTSPSYTSLFQFYHAVAVSSPLDHIILDQLLGIDPQTLAKSSVWTKFLPGQAVRENVDLSQFPYLCEGDGMQHVEVCYAILPINTFYQHILSIRSHPFVEQPFHTSYQHTLSTHPTKIGATSTEIERSDPRDSPKCQPQCSPIKLKCAQSNCSVKLKRAQSNCPV